MSLMRWLIILLIFISAGFIYFFVDVTQPIGQPHAKVIIIGATSGIGEALAHELAHRGYSVGITGRREQRLVAIKQKIGATIYYRAMDVTHPEQAQQTLNELIQEMGGMDIIIINAGTGNLQLDWPHQKKIIDTNVTGFVAMATVATEYFIQQGHGHIVGISSIAALRGIAGAPAYSASKAFVSNYLDGLRARFKRMNTAITVTNIEPGLVDTAMGSDADWRVADAAVGGFLRATPEKAATQIVDAIERHYEHAYVTKRWRLIAWAFKLLPDWIFHKLV